MKKPAHDVATVDDIKLMRSRGPWTTKSGGKLDVLFAIPRTTLEARYLHYEETELADIPDDIRGLRVYMVRDLPKESIGGTEWHRVREEMVFASHGSVEWICEDLFGGKKDFQLTPTVGVWMPPCILHTYIVMEAGSELLVIANTLFTPEDPRTHDTYSLETFRALQEEYSKAKK